MTHVKRYDFAQHTNAVAELYLPYETHSKNHRLRVQKLSGIVLTLMLEVYVDLMRGPMANSAWFYLIEIGRTYPSLLPMRGQLLGD